MPDATAPIKLGANIWNQYTDWAAFRTAMLRAESLGYDSLWTWDHVYPIVGSPDGPILEAWTAMAAIAALTTRPTIGHLVAANTFRNPALTAKMITTIDHISGGRAVLGIGAAWFEAEHTGFGIEYGGSPGERLRWLGEALPIIRGMLDGTEPTAEGPRYRAHAVRNDPPPVQEHLPILIGGSGRKVTLKLVARYADANNLGNPIEAMRDAEAALVEHCRALGRDEASIERTCEVQRVVIRDDSAEARRVQAALLAANGGAQEDEVRPGSGDIGRERGAVGTPDEVFAHLAPIVEAGYHHIICCFPAPYDMESMERMATEIRPRLEALVAR
jgi:alkanesulfonate monooxygenase SsuD/methylene tetrahydromethanopterin reductase-like flavin-dependent oxidoreductase (luciferase family)